MCRLGACLDAGFSRRISSVIGFRKFLLDPKAISGKQEVRSLPKALYTAEPLGRKKVQHRNKRNPFWRVQIPILRHTEIAGSLLALRFFSSLPETMLSLFMCVANGVSWVEVIRPLKARKLGVGFAGNPEA